MKRFRLTFEVDNIEDAMGARQALIELLKLFPDYGIAREVCQDCYELKPCTCERLKRETAGNNQ